MGLDDKLRNATEGAGGKAKEALGKGTDDPQLEAEGKIHEPLVVRPAPGACWDEGGTFSLVGREAGFVSKKSLAAKCCGPMRPSGLERITGSCSWAGGGPGAEAEALSPGEELCIGTS